MKYAKMNDCWYAIDTKQEIEFGSFAINQYNSLVEYKTKQPILDNNSETIVNELMEIIKLHLTNSPSKNKLDKIDSYLKNVYQFTNYFPVTNECINGKWYITYNVNETALDESELNRSEILKEWMVFLDLQEMRNSKYTFKECIRCKDLFASPDGRRKYCVKCYTNYRANYDKEYVKRPKGVRNKVKKYLRSTNMYEDYELDIFKEESDIKLKELSPDDFIKWCNMKKDEYELETQRRRKEEKYFLL